MAAQSGLGVYDGALAWWKEDSSSGAVESMTMEAVADIGAPRVEILGLEQKSATIPDR